MKRTVFAVIFAALLLSGCENNYPPMEQLPPEEFAPRTSSTYTGTTVDFIYMSTKATPRLPSNELDMPDIPDFNSDRNPFDESFYELFTGEMSELQAESFPETTTSTLSEDESAKLTENESEPVSPTETAITEVPPETAEAVSGTVTVSSRLSEREKSVESAVIPSETTQSSQTAAETYLFPESFDIKEYMPSADEYPKFTGFDIKSLY